MKKMKFILLLLMAAIAAPAAAQVQQLPIDPEVKIGKLDNGLTLSLESSTLTSSTCFALL